MLSGQSAVMLKIPTRKRADLIVISQPLLKVTAVRWNSRGDWAKFPRSSDATLRNGPKKRVGVLAAGSGEKRRLESVAWTPANPSDDQGCENQRERKNGKNRELDRRLAQAHFRFPDYEHREPRRNPQWLWRGC